MKESIMFRIRTVLGRIFGTADRSSIRSDKGRIEAAEKAIRSAPRGKVRRVLQTTAPASILAALLSACAAPQAEQGRASQGGSTGQQPVVVNNIVFHGNVKTDSVTTGTAAPSAASEATAEQKAKAEVPVTVDASGVVPSAGVKAEAVKAAASVAEKVVEPKPEPAPVPVPVEVTK